MSIAYVPPQLIDWIKRKYIRGNTRSYSFQSHLNELAKRMQKIGYKMLGEGAYSGVFQHPEQPDKVIKVTLSTKDGYHRYVEWVMMMKKILPKKYSKHLPVIHHTMTLHNCRITVLEKLDKKWNKTDSYKAQRDFLEYNPLADVLDDARRQLGLNNDIKTNGNILYRRRTPVVSDPWSHRTY